MRVYQLAKELNLSSKEIIEKLEKIDCPVSSHMALISDDIVERLKTNTKSLGSNSVILKKINFEAEKQLIHEDIKKIDIKKIQDLDLDTDLIAADPIITEALLFPEDENTFFGNKGGGSKLATVRPRRRRRKRFKAANEGLGVPVVVSEVRIDKDLTVAQIAEVTGKSIATVVLAFLKKGKMYTVNQVVSQKEIIELCADFEIAVTSTSVESSNKSPALRSNPLETVSAKVDLRMPIVVVMGHVDHGKTSLLDYIRTTSVAAGEAGGITQKISAYQVKTAFGEIVFIDTPGHEAFTLMRRCGAKITDIALIVIAADDGIMPQTEEALALAKKTGAQIIIALNKVDKPGLEKNIDSIKNLLSSKYDVLIEEWGGDVILVPVSAKTGQGVEHLLEMIALQSEVMDLKAHRDHAARAFVLESNFQKGLGPVSSIIITEGELKRGDSFVCGKTFGKAKLIENAFGKKVVKAGPSNLVKLVGFESLVEPGDILMVQDVKDIAKKTLNLTQSSLSQALTFGRNEDAVQVEKEAEIRLILKVGTGGTLDAITKAFEKACGKNPELKKRLVINKVSVGDVSCGDVVLAEDTDSEIFVFATGIERSAAEMASEKKIKISSFSIIYKLVETAEELVKQKSDQETIYKEVGKAEVIKVFAIKGKGVIAGCKIVEGKFVRNGKVICQRNNKVIAEVEISSLQHSKKSVSEVRKGFECGFVTDNFDGWQEGDIVICLEPVKRGSVLS